MPRQATIRWTPSEELSALEKTIIKRCERVGRFFSFLRRHRHELFDEAFQQELATLYSDSPRGQRPVPPARLAMVTIVQAMQGTSDAAAVEQAIFDRRWQMVLDCLGEDKAPFSQGVLVEFRRRLLARGMHERLIAQSV